MIYASETGRCERNDKGIKKGKEIRKNQGKFKIRENKRSNVDDARKKCLKCSEWEV